MSGIRLRRTILAILIVALLLPLASAYAAPARQAESALALRLADWSRILLQPVSELLSLLRPVAEASSMPPGQHPGNHNSQLPTSQAREGNGIDPHGGRP